MKTKICILLANMTVGAALMLLSGCATQTPAVTNVPSAATGKTVTTDKPAATATVEAPKANSIATAPAATAPAATAPAATAPAATAPTAAAPAAVANTVTLKVVKVDSEETAGEDGKGANAVDGNSQTIWHTQWQDDSPACPHEIIIELTPPSTIKGFTYLPRQDDSENGTIKDYEFYVSDDGKDFGQPVTKGSFESGKEKKTVTFDPKKCRFIKLKALSEINDNAWTSAAEIGVVLNN
jgi:alpha-glucosidase